MKITGEDVSRIAGLSRLVIDPEEHALFQKQLSNILDYIEKLNEISTDSVEPTSHVITLENVVRQDTPNPSLPCEDALFNAPDRSGNFYRVPKIID